MDKKKRLIHSDTIEEILAILKIKMKDITDEQLKDLDAELNALAEWVEEQTIERQPLWC